MTRKFKMIYVPIETYNKIKRLQTDIKEIMLKKPKLYEVIEILIALKVEGY